MLPHVGGKVPESAFETDRLALNRLQKEGIAIPDGVLLEQRNPQVCIVKHFAKFSFYRLKQVRNTLTQSQL